MLLFLRHVRPINLLLVALTQCLFYFLIFKNNEQLGPLILDSNLYLFLFIICTCIIAAGGYLINDFFDYEIDSISYPNKKSLSKSALLMSYVVVLWLGFIISVLIAKEIDKYPYIGIYILASAALYLYAWKLKSNGFSGNVLVSFFSAGVIAILWFAEKEFLDTSNILIQSIEIKVILVFYLAFVFLISLIREIIKDCEDLKADRLCGLQTLPITNGLVRTNMMVAGLIILSLVLGISWLIFTWPKTNVITGIFFTFFVILYLVYLLMKLNKTKTSMEYKSLSIHCKLIMLFGLIYFVILNSYT